MGRLASVYLALAMLGAATAATAQDRRPVRFSAFYVSYAALAVGDVVTTASAEARGAHEANPVRAALGKGRWPGAVVQGAGTVFTIWAVDKVRRDGHPTAAFVTLVALNALSAVVVGHNSQVRRR